MRRGELSMRLQLLLPATASVMNVSERREEMRRGKGESSEVVKRRFIR
jgi:hypothetical protein